MSQVVSPEVGSGSGLSVRQAINAVLAALMSNNSGPSAPANPVAGAWWFDTTTGLIRIRNAANTGWLSLSDLIGAVEYSRIMSLDVTQKARARTNIGLGAVATDDVVPITRGGTGAPDAATARASLGAAARLPAAGAVESFVWAHHNTTNVVYGGVYWGSQLQPTGASPSIYIIGTGFTAAAGVGAPLEGSWICLGHAMRQSSTPNVAGISFACLFQRIA